MCRWVKLSDFGVKHSMLLNTPYVKEMVDNNYLYVVPKDVHLEMMNTNNFSYTHLGTFDIGKYGMYILGRVRSIDVNNHMVEIDFDKVFEDYIDTLKDPRISFLAYTGLNKTGPVFYIHENVEERMVSA